ncbi:hypothetical protein IQ06DRAFT_45018 [Phaeosphaeriaceae sp. SRC1lsM3a]|nr:hypothetical protein IQ06DRAFT_45018 [Stagonospora sp. SRC1lsM3a]
MLPQGDGGLDSAHAIKASEEIDWACVWRSCNPTTAPFLGLQNRARVWADCQRIINLNIHLREQGVVEANDVNAPTRDNFQ